jgi:hypothetical protein
VTQSQSTSQIGRAMTVVGGGRPCFFFVDHLAFYAFNRKAHDHSHSLHARVPTTYTSSYRLRSVSTPAAAAGLLRESFFASIITTSKVSDKEDHLTGHTHTMSVSRRPGSSSSCVSSSSTRSRRPRQRQGLLMLAPLLLAFLVVLSTPGAAAAKLWGLPLASTYFD